MSHMIPSVRLMTRLFTLEQYTQGVVSISGESHKVGHTHVDRCKNKSPMRRKCKFNFRYFRADMKIVVVNKNKNKNAAIDYILTFLVLETLSHTAK